MKALVALSGGPKSMVTSWLLKKQGMQVRGVYFDLFGNEALKSKMQELEKKLGFPIQIVDVSASLGEILELDYSDFVTKAFPFNPKISFHRKILFPALFKIRSEMQIDRIATGHQVTLQEDLSAGLVRVVHSAGVRLEEISCLVTVPQAELSRILAPIGAIPESMLHKLVGEVAPDSLTAPFEVDWESLRASFDSAHAESLQHLFQVFTGEGVILDSVPRASLWFGGLFKDPSNPEHRYRVTDLRPSESKAVVRQVSGGFTVRDFQFDEGHWFSRADLGLRPAITGMIWEGRSRPVEIRLIQFDGGKMRGILSEPLQEEGAGIFKGTPVFFVNGFEVLGAARVTGIR
ncbi:MAG: hypothetical protein EBX52_02390 [Proteobacteria bacterium]|nr:hypothetical protein [Pseudomonadota bacterium]